MLTVLCITVNAQTVKIAAASDMKYIMPEIILKYKTKNPQANIDVAYGSSGLFFQQISSGANYDIYFSADISYTQRLKEQGFVIGDIKTYAFGALVLWSSTIDVSKGIGILNNSSIKKIAIANPKHAPYGKRAEECLKYYKIYDKVSDKLVFGDNITQTAQFAVTGNVDIAFIALAIAEAPEMKFKGTYFKLDSKSYNPLEQACVLLKNSNPEAAKFMKYVLSNECKPIFEKYGFILP